MPSNSRASWFVNSNVEREVTRFLVPDTRRKLPVAVTPSTYRYRARHRLYPLLASLSGRPSLAQGPQWGRNPPLRKLAPSSIMTKDALNGVREWLSTMDAKAQIVIIEDVPAQLEAASLAL